MEGKDMNLQEYMKNRSQFPLDQLESFAGQYVAWSPDGRRIVASAKDFEELDSLVRTAGENPEECVIEGIPAQDTVVGGAFFEARP